MATGDDSQTDGVQPGIVCARFSGAAHPTQHNTIHTACRAVLWPGARPPGLPACLPLTDHTDPFTPAIFPPLRPTDRPTSHYYSGDKSATAVAAACTRLTAERTVPGLIPVLGSQPARDASHKPGGRLPLLSARPAVTLATPKSAATNFAAW